MPDAPSPFEVAVEWAREGAPAAVAGQGGHDATFQAACLIVGGFGLSVGEEEEVMRVYNGARCSPMWSEVELLHKLGGARAVPGRYPAGWLYRKICKERGWRWGGGGEGGAGWRSGGAGAAPRREVRWKLAFEVAKLRAVQPGVAVDEGWLRGRSPMAVEGVGPEAFLRAVFDWEDKVLIFTKFASQGQFIFWRGGVYALGDVPGVGARRVAGLPKGGEEGVWFLSQPVTGEWRPNPRSVDAGGRPKMSRRSEESVAGWRHLVLEADPSPEVRGDAGRLAEFERLWLGFLCNLPLPVKAIYSSGGKSVHALIWLPAETKLEWDKLRAVVGPVFSRLGADPAAIRAVQLTRLPGCWRGGRLQRLLYLDPAPDRDGVEIWKGGLR